MTYHLQSLDSAPDRAEFDALLTEYWQQIIAGLESLGAPGFSTDLPVRDFWNTLDKVLPPQGELVLARDGAGRLVGCGSLTDIGAGTGELKRLFVRPEARGTGLGRRLVMHRIATARRMGLTRLVVDTIRTTKAMQSIYADLGFTPMPPSDQSASAQAFPQMRPYMLFFERHLDEAET